jgi:hypothetical protein
MPQLDAWLSSQLAADEVERRLAVSWGTAQKALLGAIESGDVRLQSRSGGFPDVWSVDFERWVQAKQPRKKRSSPQQDLAKKAIAALYNGHIPDGLTPKQLEKPVNEWLKAQGKAAVKRDAIVATQLAHRAGCLIFDDHSLTNARQSGMSGSADPVKAITDTWTEGLGRTRMHRRLRPPHGHRRLLRTRLERPRRRAAAEKRDELAAFNHSSTSSARPSKAGGISRPRALAVFRLITNSKWVGCSTGRSAG